MADPFERIRAANPVPDPDRLVGLGGKQVGDPVWDELLAVVRREGDGRPVPPAGGIDQEGHRDGPHEREESTMPATDIDTRARGRTRRWVAAVAVVVVIAAGIVLVVQLGDDDPPVLGGPGGGADPTEPVATAQLALRAVRANNDAINAGDAVGALAVTTPEVREDPRAVANEEFLAAIGAQGLLSDCETRPLMTGQTRVLCTLTLDDPVYDATQQPPMDLEVLVDADGLLTGLPSVNNSLVAHQAFAEYARQAESDAFDAVCAVDAYEPGSVFTWGGDHAWTGSCGELWARLADDVAAWVGAGRPDIG